MTHRQRRCIHCGKLYYYQTSGAGCGSSAHSAEYCDDCWGVVREALSKVPPAVEQTWIVLEGEERAKALALRDQQKAPVSLKVDPNLPSISVRRVAFPLFNINAETGEFSVHSNTLSYEFEQVPHTIETFLDGVTPEKVTKAMERNLKTGFTVPWRRIRGG